MPRTCTICTTKQVSRVNSLIGQNKSFRYIALQMFNKENRHQSIYRHATNCLKFDVQKALKEKKIESAIEAYNELAEQLSFAKDLRDASRKALTDAETGEICLIPRSDEVEVVYYDLADCKDNGEPKKKREDLQVLLDRLNGKQVDSVKVSSTDIKQFALNAIKTAEPTIDKLAKIAGDYTDNKENPENITREQKAQQFYEFLKNKMSVKKAIDATKEEFKLPEFQPEKEYID